MKYLLCLFLIFSCQQKTDTSLPNVETQSADSKTKSPTAYFHKTLRDCLDGQMVETTCYETLEFHLSNGANINAPDDSMLALPPLHWAILDDNQKMVEFLLAKGAGVNSKSEGTIYPQLTPLGFFKHLVEKGQKLNSSIEDTLKKKGAN